jgi:hypothetical protein
MPTAQTPQNKPGSSNQASEKPQQQQAEAEKAKQLQAQKAQQAFWILAVQRTRKPAFKLVTVSLTI